MRRSLITLSTTAAEEHEEGIILLFTDPETRPKELAEGAGPRRRRGEATEEGGGEAT